MEVQGQPLLACNNCEETYELKSRSKPLQGKIIYSVYSIKLKQIAAGTNPSFLFLHYEPSWQVANLFAVPKHIFHPTLIQRRNSKHSFLLIVSLAASCSIGFPPNPKRWISKSFYFE